MHLKFSDQTLSIGIVMVMEAIFFKQKNESSHYTHNVNLLHMSNSGPYLRKLEFLRNVRFAHDVAATILKNGTFSMWWNVVNTENPRCIVYIYNHLKMAAVTAIFDDQINFKGACLFVKWTMCIISNFMHLRPLQNEIGIYDVTKFC